MSEKAKQLRGPAVREKFIDVATDLFYANGVHAVGIDEVISRTGMAKASLYRRFPSKDDLVLAVLQRRDDQFWAAWDETATRHPDPRAQLDAQLARMQRLATGKGYRGCAFVNTAAEFDSEANESIRRRCLAHQEELRRRLGTLTTELGTEAHDRAERLADQLTIAIVGAFAVGGLYPTGGPAAQLRALADDLIAATVGAAPPADPIR
ncbi:TetR/AcrR family transcriptional regulator [Nocardia sp. NBC_01377]|uniref:TetR/AcrR family transcriptional regulator n=1 Tax=Nocardia sp. NBC_01377 TaxID=2903595 RepID=UPI00324B6229